jgi:uncharacterized protein (TIGR02186 family)
MRRVLVAIAIWIAAAAPGVAQESIVSELSQRRIGITANFDGSEIILFGAVKREEPINLLYPLSVIITVSGPLQPVTVRRKARVAGIWANTAAVEVDAAPSFYAVATTRPLDQALSNTEDLRWKISIPRAIRSVGAPATVRDSPVFTQALIRIRLKNGAYQMNENTIAFFDQTLFSTSVTLPANLIEGDYRVSLYLTRNREVIAYDTTTLFVRKVGLERWLYRLAHDRPLVYGLMSIFIAIAAGWIASAIFKRVR